MKRKLFLKGLFVAPFVFRKEWANTKTLDLKPRKKLRFDVSKQIYFNWGTMGVMPKSVINSMKEDLDYVGEYRDYGHLAHEVERRLAKLVNADVSEVVITKNATEGTCIASTAIPISQGDEILISNHEHIGGCANWINMANQKSAEVKTFAMGKSAIETLDNFKGAITGKTKIVAFPHIPCTTGLVLPVKAMAKYAKTRGITVCIDGAHVLGMLAIDVKTIDCDCYYGCLHKWLNAPLGSGWLYSPKKSLAKYKSSMTGAYGVSSYSLVDKPELVINELNAAKFAYGTYSTALRAGILQAIEVYEKIGAERVEQRVVELSRYLHAELQGLGNLVDLLIDPKNKSISGITGMILRKNGDNVSHEFIKSHYGEFRLRFVAESNLDCLRISVHYTNTKDEIDTFIRAIKAFCTV